MGEAEFAIKAYRKDLSEALKSLREQEARYNHHKRLLNQKEKD
jgi:hypothetical protein